MNMPNARIFWHMACLNKGMWKVVIIIHSLRNTGTSSVSAEVPHAGLRKQAFKSSGQTVTHRPNKGLFGQFDGNDRIVLGIECDL